MTEPSSSSPKSSITSSSPTSTHHPHFHAFHRRFHPKSNAHSTPIETPPEPTPVSAPVRTEAVRDAKRFLLSAIRDDWSYPPEETAGRNELDPREPIDYRHREEGPSDLEPDSDEPATKSKDSSDPYRFESPDAIASTMLDRRRKRRRAIYEEMQWNDGMCIWSQRRDAWTGAVKSRPRRSSDHDATTLPATNGHSHQDPTEMSIDIREPPNSTVASSEPPSSNTYTDLTHPDNSAGPLLPVYPPLIPLSNPVRSSIKPSIYPALYSKVVVQALTPTVPIPLPDMVAAMVQGWKAEGNWPPKPTAPEPSIRAKTSDGRQGRGHMLRFRRGHEHLNGNVEKVPRVRMGVGGKMRKALGLRNDEERMEQDLDLNGDGSGLGMMEFEAQRDPDGDQQMDIREEKSGNISDGFRVS